MPSYTYFGGKSLYQGKPLFHLLCRLRDCGVGRIVYRTSEVLHDYPGEIGFYRILLAQPQMDKAGLHGRVVAEQVFRGRKMPEPKIISEKAHKPDFRLVPKTEEASFCRWDSIKDYNKAEDAPVMPKFAEMPPLMRKIVEINRLKRGQTTNKEDFLLPMHKIYMEDVNIEDKIESNEMWKVLDSHHGDFDDFDLDLIPDGWTLERWNTKVGRKRYAGYWEGEDGKGHAGIHGLDEQLRRNKREEELKEILSKNK